MEPDDDDYPPEDRAEFANLDESDTAAIDAEILKAVSSEWRKVAYVIGTVMAEIRKPDIIVAQRVKALATSGHLESRGHLGRMHYSEVRLPP